MAILLNAFGFAIVLGWTASVTGQVDSLPISVDHVERYSPLLYRTVHDVREKSNSMSMKKINYPAMHYHRTYYYETPAPTICEEVEDDDDNDEYPYYYYDPYQGKGKGKGDYTPPGKGRNYIVPPRPGTAKGKGFFVTPGYAKSSKSSSRSRKLQGRISNHNIFEHPEKKSKSSKSSKSSKVICRPVDTPSGPPGSPVPTMPPVSPRPTIPPLSPRPTEAPQPSTPLPTNPPGPTNPPAPTDPPQPTPSPGQPTTSPVQPTVPPATSSPTGSPTTSPIQPTVPPVTPIPTTAPTDLPTPNIPPTSNPTIGPTVTQTLSPTTTTASPTTATTASPTTASPTSPQTSSPTSLPTTASPTNLPTEIPPDLDVDASQFFALYEFDGADPDLTDSNFQQAAAVTANYINDYMIAFFEFSEDTTLENVQTSIGEFEQDPVRIGYDVSFSFGSDSTLVPSQELLDSLIIQAFQQPNVQALVAALRGIPGNNPFATTTDVSYTTPDGTLFLEGPSLSGAGVAAVAAGCLLVASALALYLTNRARRRGIPLLNRSNSGEEAPKIIPVSESEETLSECTSSIARSASPSVRQGGQTLKAIDEDSETSFSSSGMKEGRRLARGYGFVPETPLREEDEEEGELLSR